MLPKPRMPRTRHSCRESTDAMTGWRGQLDPSCREDGIVWSVSSVVAVDGLEWGSSPSWSTLTSWSWMLFVDAVVAVVRSVFLFGFG